MDEARGRDFQSSLVWQKAHQFVLSVYNYSDYFPQKEAGGLTTQLRRAAIQIALNTAEALRQSDFEKAASLKSASNAIEQCRYYLILAKDLGYGDHPELLPQLKEVKRMLDELGKEISSTGF